MHCLAPVCNVRLKTSPSTTTAAAARVPNLLSDVWKPLRLVFVFFPTIIRLVPLSKSHRHVFSFFWLTEMVNTANGVRWPPASAQTPTSTLVCPPAPRPLGCVDAIFGQSQYCFSRPSPTRYLAISQTFHVSLRRGPESTGFSDPRRETRPAPNT